MVKGGEGGEFQSLKGGHLIFGPGPETTGHASQLTETYYMKDSKVAKSPS